MEGHALHLRSLAKPRKFLGQVARSDRAGEKANRIPSAENQIVMLAADAYLQSLLLLLGLVIAKCGYSDFWQGIAPVVQLTYLSRLFISGPHVDEMSGVTARDILAELGPGVEMPGALFANTLSRIQTSSELEEMIIALDQLDPEERSRLLDMANTVLQGGYVFIHNAWACEQLADQDLGPSLTHYERMSQIVSTWKQEDIESELAIAQSVILDEGLNDEKGALAIIADAIERFGKRPALIRQKSKVLAHQGNAEAAAALLISVEPELDQLAPFDRALALRDGAVQSANANRLEDAARLFGKSRMILEAEQDHVALQIGLRIEEALVAWARSARRGALSTVADALEALEELDPTTSRQNEWAHMVGRAIIGLFKHDLEPFPSESRPEFAFGRASELAGEGELQRFDLKSLADNWRILELVENEAQVEAGIANRSARHQESTRNIFIEFRVATARFTTALQCQELSEALAAAQAAVSILRMVRDKDITSGSGLARAQMEEFEPVSIDALCERGHAPVLQAALADILLVYGLAGQWDDVLGRLLGAAVRDVWGDDSLIQPLLAASTGSYAIGPTASMAVVTCQYLKTFNEDKEMSPGERFLRDLNLVFHVANSIARKLLEPQIVKRLETGWRMMLNDQRFALSAPALNVPPIDTALQALPKVGIRGARALFEAASPAVGVSLSPDWEEFLAKLEGGQPVTA